MKIKLPQGIKYVGVNTCMQNAIRSLLILSMQYLILSTMQLQSTMHMQVLLPIVTAHQK